METHFCNRVIILLELLYVGGQASGVIARFSKKSLM